MNLFCFTLEGSTESIYEPVHNPTLKEVLPKHQCRPALVRHKYELGGSDPSINTDQPQSITKLKRNNRRSCMPASALENETLVEGIDFTCWISSDGRSDLYNQKKMQNRAPSQSGLLTRDDEAMDPSSERTQNVPAKSGETTDDTAESRQTTRRQKKFQNLVQAKKGHLSDGEKVKREAKRNECLTNMMRNHNVVLTCISLGRRTEKRSSYTATSSQDLVKQHTRGHHEDAEEEGVWRSGYHLWRPFDCPQSWAPIYHTCQQTRHEMWTCGGNLSLPQSSEWDRFESLIHELDSKQSALSHPQETQGQNCEVIKLKLQGREMENSSQSDRKQGIKASPEKTPTVLSVCHTQTVNTDLLKDDAERKEASHGRTFPKGQKQCRNSLESLYSLHSGQSSSSGVTSGSDCSSNRDSLRLEDDLSFTKQFCGRARVHTEYVPSPYDTESLRLKVGDVIDIIAKRPMGIWTGMLNGKIGNFKFIYVDVLMERSYETHIHEGRLKSTVQEVLKRISLEEYSSLLQLGGYQTVDDLMRLKEHDLMELNMTNSEHRQQLLTAIKSLQQLCSDSWLENESIRGSENFTKDIKTETNNCSRDSGCLITSESPDECTEEAAPPFHSTQPRPVNMATS